MLLLLLLLLLPLLCGIECVGGQGSQAWSQGLSHRFQLQVQRSVTVQEGLCVFIPCSFSYSGSGRKVSSPVLGHWFQKEAIKGNDNSDTPVATNDPRRKVKEETKGRFQLLGDPQNGSCSLVIRDAQKRDTATYFFQMETRYHRKHNFMKSTLSLEVTGLTQKPDVYVPEILEPGHPVTLLCVFSGLFEGCPAPTFSWIGEAISPEGTRPQASFFSALALTPRSQDNNTEVTCQVAFSRNSVSSTRTIWLNVAGKLKLWREFIQAAFVGAGFTILLFFCPYFIFLMVKSWRRKTTRTVAGRPGAPSVSGTIAWGQRKKSKPGGPPGLPSQAVAAPTSGEEQGLQYTSLVFHGLRPREPQGQQTPRTEYAEIKI